MRVELPDGQHAEIRDRLNGGDRVAVLDSVKLKVGSGGLQEIGAGVQAKQHLALLRRLITSWSLDGYPLPLAEPENTVEPVLHRLDLDTLDALLEATEPLFDKVANAGKSSKPSSSGSPDGPSPETLPPSPDSL